MTDIAIRQIQHFLYCKHRWGLMEIDRDWAENVYVTKANLLHKRVHDPDKDYTLRGRKVFTSVEVYNPDPENNIYGFTDCIEGREDSSGTKIVDNKKYLLTIVEYKPTAPKNKEYNYDDLMQVFAQKICVDHVFSCNCQGVLYYADKKKRVLLPLEENYEEYNTQLKKILAEMRYYFENGIIPPIDRGQKCDGCSMKDICMPKLHLTESVRKRIQKIIESDV